ncbi:hypothetical protein P171DRAFT_464579 [Karstenula rhodostoma CBS 690.94]|uniref:Uncharacterized protein n=1 Tax=Karstenula rhodostoma CBS 690.94 TaxID=1392251 RepID=A0A9P4PF34_9PLEO|nr:hypothetical protein P171DRAFT_464579 [Karstenula rhodostoma CBS 690.94]
MWRYVLEGAFFFIVITWWVQSRAWYPITGLLLADMAANMDFKAKAQRGIKIWQSIRCPSYFAFAAILVAELVLQYLWAAWRPEYRHDELVAHGRLYYTGGLNEDFDTSDMIQWALANPLFVYLGRQSLSWFLVQSILIYTIGIRLIEALHMASEVAATAACFFVVLVTTAVGSGDFYRAVEVPSHVLSYVAFDWIRD